MSLFSRNSNKNNPEGVVDGVESSKGNSEKRTDGEVSVISDVSGGRNIKFPTGDMSRDLMILIGKAITEWSEIYNKKGMPQKVILGQVIALLNAWYKDL